MTYYGAKELAEAFRTVRRNTITIAEEIPEEKYDFQPAPDTRSVRRLLTHVALAYNIQHQIQAVEKRTTLEGLDFPSIFQRLSADEQKSRSKAEILEMLKTGGEVWAKFLDSASDNFLAESVGMPPGMTPASKSRFEMILGVKEHEMHHRGQLMLIERMLGLVPHLTRQMQARMQQAAAASARP
jgi:uncharacterized damage-inducible protein DinB